MTGLLVAAAAFGACFQQQQIVHQSSYVPQSYAHSYVAPQQVLYFVGQPIRVQSLLEQQKRTDPDYQEFLKFKAWKAGAKNQQQKDTQKQQASGELPPPEPTPTVTVRSACAKCHGKATPAGDFHLDGEYGIEPSRITQAIRAIASGEMPKDRELSAQEKNQLLADLLSLEYQETETESEGEP